VSVPESINITEFPVFYLFLTTFVTGSSTDPPASVGSHYFNVTKDRVISSSSATSESVTSPPSTSNSLPSTASPTSSAQSGAGISAPLQKTSLSPGITAGIVIAVVIVVSSAASLLYLFWRRRRQGQRVAQGDDKGNDYNNIWQKAELDTTVLHDITKNGSRVEMDGGSHWVHEMSGRDTRIFELPGVTSPRNNYERELPPLPNDDNIH
jgi:hypothetical protein